MLTSVLRRLVASVLDSDSAAQDEDVQRTSLPSSIVVVNKLPNPNKFTERIRHLVQIAIPLSRRIRHPIPWYVHLPRETHASHAKTIFADLLWTDPFRSLWNTTFKLVFIGTSAYIIYLMLNDYKPTHDPNLDTFRVQYLVAGSAVLGIIFPYKYEFSEVGHNRPGRQEKKEDADTIQMLWAFSIWLEAVAILPQLFMLQRTGEAETITTHYLFALGAYRALYIPNWIYRYATEGHFEPISVVAGLVQTILYSDFFYIYYTK